MYDTLGRFAGADAIEVSGDELTLFARAKAILVASPQAATSAGTQLTPLALSPMS